MNVLEYLPTHSIVHINVDNRSFEAYPNFPADGKLTVQSEEWDTDFVLEGDLIEGHILGEYVKVQVEDGDDSTMAAMMVRLLRPARIDGQ